MATVVNGDGVSTSNLSLTSPNVPATPTSVGVAGDIAWDADYIYLCVATNTWARTNNSIHWGAL